MSDFQELAVWQLAKKLAVEVYRVTKRFNFYNNGDFISQIRRAAISVSSNIAEGEESGTIKSGIRYLNIAKGSNSEVKSQIIVAFDLGFVSEQEMKLIKNICEEISKKPYFLIKYRKTKI